MSRLLAGIALGLWSVPALVAAQQPQQPQQQTEVQLPISVRVRVVQADEVAPTDQATAPGDDDMKDLRRSLGPMQFGSLRTVQDEQLRLQFGEQAYVWLPTGDSVQLVPISVVQRRLHMHVQAPKINGRLQMLSGKPVVVSGPRHGKGRLIIHIVPDF